MVLDPRLRRGRNPASYIEDALVVLKQGPRKDRLVMGDPIAQLPQSVQRPMSLLARQGHAMRERATKRRPPECHLVVRPAAIRVHAATGPEQRHPEAEAAP